MRGGRLGEGLVFGGGDPVTLHEGLGEVLRALELRRFLGRAEHLQAALAEVVDDAGRQRRFRADQGEGNLLVLGEIGEIVERAQLDVLQARILRGAAVAGRNVDGLNARRLGELPGERMFAAAGTDDE